MLLQKLVSKARPRYASGQIGRAPDGGNKGAACRCRRLATRRSIKAGAALALDASQIFRYLPLYFPSASLGSALDLLLHALELCAKLRKPLRGLRAGGNRFVAVSQPAAQIEKLLPRLHARGIDVACPLGPGQCLHRIGHGVNANALQSPCVFAGQIDLRASSLALGDDLRVVFRTDESTAAKLLEPRHEILKMAQLLALRRR